MVGECISMPRTARLEYAGACYHVINRGNYRSDIFKTDGARAAFERTLFEACERSGWRLHAYVIMRNHFHLALETPEPNLSEGMKWLQGTWVSRFNRLRKIQGRPFQGRFKALLVQRGHALAEVSHYIHLNPVRAKVVSADALATFRWSSFYHFFNQTAPSFLEGLTVRAAAGRLTDSARGWKAYLSYLAFRVSEEPEAQAIQFKRLSRGWSIGDDQFRQEIRERLARASATKSKRFEGMSSADWAVERSRKWEEVLELLVSELKIDRKKLGPRTSDPNKVLLAYLLKRTTDVSNGWIADRLKMGQPATVSQYVRRFKLAKQDETAEVQKILSRIKQCPL